MDYWPLVIVTLRKSAFSTYIFRKLVFIFLVFSELDVISADFNSICIIDNLHNHYNKNNEN